MVLCNNEKSFSLEIKSGVDKNIGRCLSVSDAEEALSCLDAYKYSDVFKKCVQHSEGRRRLICYQVLIEDALSIEDCKAMTNSFAKAECFDRGPIDFAAKCKDIRYFSERIDCYGDVVSRFRVLQIALKEQEQTSNTMYATDYERYSADAMFISSNQLVRPNPYIKIGQKIATLGGLGCFVFSQDEYRCVRRGTNSSVLISAKNVPIEFKAWLESNCYTFIRGFKDPKCGFNIAFVVGERGIDHLESMQIYITSMMMMKKHNKYEIFGR